MVETNQHHPGFDSVAWLRLDLVRRPLCAEAILMLERVRCALQYHTDSDAYVLIRCFSQDEVDYLRQSFSKVLTREQMKRVRFSWLEFQREVPDRKDLRRG